MYHAGKIQAQKYGGRVCVKNAGNAWCCLLFPIPVFSTAALR